MQETIKQCQVTHQTLTQQEDKQDKRWNEYVKHQQEEGTLAIQHHEIMLNCFRKTESDMIQVPNLIGNTLQTTTITSNQINTIIEEQLKQVKLSLEDNQVAREQINSTLTNAIKDIHQQFTQLHLQYIAEIGENYSVINQN
jgi:hypothetical protein